jgi:hypothetical protein
MWCSISNSQMNFKKDLEDARGTIFSTMYSTGFHLNHYAGALGSDFVHERMLQNDQS